MRTLAFLTCAIMLLAGCADDGTTQTPPTEPEPLDAAPPENGTSLPVAPPNQTTAPDLTNRTSLYWATDAALGDTALEVVVDFGRDNECDVTTTVAGRADGPGVRAVNVRELENGYGWGASGGGSLATAYAGPVDTRTLLDSSGQYASGSAGRGGFDGVGTVTVVGLGLEPWENRLSGDKSLSLDMECSKPFSVVRARVGHEVLLASDESMHGGVGATQYLAGSAMVQATASLDVTAPQGRAIMGHFGDEEGRVVVDHPSGEATWMITGQGWSMPSVEDGPGTYAFTVDRVGVRFEAFWLAAFGLASEVDLLPGLQDEPTFESPF